MELSAFDLACPLDYRYYLADRELFERLRPYVSEEARIRYMLKVEAALAEALADRGVCPREAAEEIAKACEEVTAEEVYEEEGRTRHDVRAMVNCVRRRVSEAARPYVHLTATSYDIIDTANAARMRDLFNDVIIPDLLELEKLLIEMARRYSGLPQIGRTHGVHAVPITFGFALARYVSRVGDRIEAIRRAVENLRGKMSGAVGAYNASSLLFDDPEKFEEEVLAKLGLRPAPHSTQIVEPQFVTDLVCAVISCFSALANLADDVRHLERTEIGELGEERRPEEIGSSTMPHKANPWDFEHVKSMWKAFMPRAITVFMDEISEHQRDLTNSASQRFIWELFAAFDHAVVRMLRALRRLRANEGRMRENLEMSKWEYAAEPLYVILAARGHPNAYERVRELLAEARRRGATLLEAAMEAEDVRPYLEGLEGRQMEVLIEPSKYLGVAERKARAVCDYWEAKLGLGG